MSSVALTVTVVLVFFLGGIAAGVVVVIAMSARRTGRDDARRLKIVSRPS